MRATGPWRARSPRSRCAGSARSARRSRGGWKKACRRRGGALEWTLIVAAAQILFLDTPDHAAVDLAVKAARADPASAPVRGARQCGAARHRPRSRRNSGQFRPPRRRHARLARPALALDLWRERRPRHRRGAPRRADARPERQKRPLRLGRAARRNCIADRLGAPRHPCAGWRTRRLWGRANGGCRTPPRRCPPGSFGRIRACASSTSAPRLAEKRPNLPRRASI